MSGRTVEEFVAYWEDEGLKYARQGDYDWMAALLPGQRILEIGCGVGFATQAMLARGLDVMAIDTLPMCLDLTRKRVGDAAVLLEADVSALTSAQRAAIAAFAPDTVVCWLMGASADVTGAKAGDGGQAVATYRERIHRALAELAASLAGVRYVHLVDRTAIPWQAKDIGRDTLVRYHQDKTFRELPFGVTREQALYRKLGGNVTPLARPHPTLKSVVPTLASLLAIRSA